MDPNGSFNDPNVLGLAISFGSSPVASVLQDIFYLHLSACNSGCCATNMLMDPTRWAVCYFIHANVLFKIPRAYLEKRPAFF